MITGMLDDIWKTIAFSISSICLCYCIIWLELILFFNASTPLYSGFGERKSRRERGKSESEGKER